MAIGPICSNMSIEVEAATFLRERRGADAAGSEPRATADLTHLPNFHYCILRK